MNNKPHIGQISHLKEWMERDEATSAHFDLTNAFEKLQRGLTGKWLRRINWLIMDKRRFELRKDFMALGFTEKKTIKPFDQFFSHAEVERRGAERQREYSLSK